MPSNFKSPTGVLKGVLVVTHEIGASCFFAANNPTEKIVPMAKSKIVNMVIIETTVTKYFLVSVEVGQTI